MSDEEHTKRDRMPDVRVGPKKSKGAAKDLTWTEQEWQFIHGLKKDILVLHEQINLMKDAQTAQLIVLEKHLTQADILIQNNLELHNRHNNEIESLDSRITTVGKTADTTRTRLAVVGWIMVLLVIPVVVGVIVATFQKMIGA